MAGKGIRAAKIADAGWPTLEQLIRQLGEDRLEIESGARRAIQTAAAHALVDVRKTLGLTQVQLAASAGMDQSRISRIERGDVTRVEVGTLAEYARALGGELELVLRIGDAAVRLAIEPDKRTTSKTA